MIEAVIFDMDGTLTDSETVSREAWRRAGDEAGHPLPAWMLETFTGMAVPPAKVLVREKLGLDDATIEGLFARHAELFMEIAEESLTLMPHARETLEALHAAGMPLALATSTARKYAEPRLDRFGLIPFFTEIVCGDEVEKSKPEPDIFLHASARLGVAAGKCAVVEDSFNGVRAGHAAGAQVFMVPDLVAPTEEIAAMCAAVLDSLHDLPEAVAACR